MPLYSDVTLSDEDSCRVRRLGIFELDAIPPPDTRPFTVSIKIGESEYEQEYEPPQEEPIRPESNGHVEGSAAWYAYRDWAWYRACMLHKKQQHEDLQRYRHDVAAYIMEHCVEPEDRPRIATAEDYAAIYHAALVPQLSRRDLEIALAHTFRASFESGPILAALESIDDDGRPDARQNVLRAWEIQAMRGMSETEWAELPLDERARKVVGHKIDDWYSALEMDYADKKRKPETWPQPA